jgi:multidrug efflux pump subunit AcrB
VHNGKPEFLQDVATLRAQITVTKKPGENAVDVANAVMRRVDGLRNTVIPQGVEVAETRNYGATANDKAQS